MTAPTSVSVQNTPGPYYTWAGCNWSWTDLRAQKAWDTSYDSTYTVSTTEGWTNGDQLGNNTTKPVSEGWATAESGARNLSKNSPESWRTAEQLANATTKPVAEAWNNAEVYGNNTSKAASEGFTTTDGGVTRQFAKNPQEGWETAERLGNATTKPLADAIHTSDSYGSQLSKAMAEAFHTVDSYLKQFGKGVPESWKTAESYTDVMAWTLRAMEAFTTGEQLGNHTALPVSEGFETVDSYFTKYGLQPTEGWTTSEALAKLINRPFAEGFASAEMLGNQTSLPFTEGFQTSDINIFNTVKGIDEAITTAELWGRTIAYLRLLDDGFTTADALANATTISQAEAFQTVEEYRRHGNGVMSNLQITTDALDENAFAQLIQATSPTGYTNFRTFITGTYTYQKALFRSVVQSTTLDRAAITDMNIAVDVPDVNDSGEAVITNAATGIAVTYNRKFHITPEVTITLKGGSDALALPKLSVAPTNTGFTVMLVDAATGNPVTGTISWAAHGY